MEEDEDIERLSAHLALLQEEKDFLQEQVKTQDRLLWSVMQRVHTAEREAFEATSAKKRMTKMLEELEKNHKVVSIELNDAKRDKRALEVESEKLMWKMEVINRRLRLFTDQPVVHRASAEVQADLYAQFGTEGLRALDEVEVAQESARSARGASKDTKE